MSVDPVVYVDTSALAKLYVSEPGSDEFEDWIRATDRVTISSLTVVEMRSLLARRRRLGQIDADTERRAFSLFQQHVDARFLALEAVNDEHVLTAARLLDSLPGCALRTLDAIHLSVCQALDPVQLATADAVMAAAARELGIVILFCSP